MNMKRHINVYGLAFTVISSALLCGSIPAPAVEVGWHDHMYLQPGDGVLLNHQQEPQSLGLVLLANPTPDNTASFTETLTFAQHTYDMIKSLSVNSSVSLDSLVFSGDVNVSFFGRQSFNANDLTFVYTATKDFGPTVYSAVDFSPTYKNLVAGLQNNLQGAALHSAVTAAVGTHYVRGYDSAAIVSVIYSFHYASASAKQQLTANGGGSWDTGSFSAFVGSFFASSNSATSMTYEFYSTDPYQLMTNSFGMIHSYQEFTNFVSRVETYANAMSRDHAKVTGYILDPLQTIPGYLSMISPYVPPQMNVPDYNGFLQAYAALQAAKQSLAPWLLRGNSMSWLNTDGRQVMVELWNEVANNLAAMKSIATDHFTTGAPLTVPPDVTTFLAGFSPIRLPEIIYMDSFVNGSDRCIIGRVDCGCSNLTASAPFYHLVALHNLTNYYSTAYSSYIPIYYHALDFETNLLAAYPSGTINSELKARFSSSLWNSLTNANPDVNGYFFVALPESQKSHWSVEVDDIDAGGQPVPVDEKTLGDSSTLSVGSTLGSCQVQTPLIQ
jgi:hypothetical protein